MTHQPTAATVAHAPAGEGRVRRDMELIRKVLLAVQAKDDLKPRLISIEGEDAELVGRHIEILFDEGFIQGTPFKSYSGPPYKQVLVTDLTWSGHDFVGSIGAPEYWGVVKSTLQDGLASLPLKVISSVSIAIVTKAIKDKLGLG